MARTRCRNSSTISSLPTTLRARAALLSPAPLASACAPLASAAHPCTPPSRPLESGLDDALSICTSWLIYAIKYTIRYLVVLHIPGPDICIRVVKASALPRHPRVAKSNLYPTSMYDHVPSAAARAVRSPT